MAKKNKLGPAKAAAMPDEVSVVEFENPGEVFAGTFRFEFSLLNEKRVELEKVWVEAEGATETEALSHAADKLQGKIWSYTGNFKKEMII